MSNVLRLLSAQGRPEISRRPLFLSKYISGSDIQKIGLRLPAISHIPRCKQWDIKLAAPPWLIARINKILTDFQTG